MTPAKKETAKKHKKKSHSEFKIKLESFALAVFTALGTAIGQGAVDAIKRPPPEVPSQSVPLPMHKEWQTDQRVFPAPQNDLPTGDEPKQRLQFTYINSKGENVTFSTLASLRGLTNSAYGTLRPAIDVPQKSADHIQINAQLHPSAPVINVSIPKKQIVEHIATLGQPSLSAEDLQSVTHINIAPEVNPEKPSKA